MYVSENHIKHKGDTAVGPSAQLVFDPQIGWVSQRSLLNGIWNRSTTQIVVNNLIY